MELIVISPEVSVSNEIESLNSLFANGLLKFHLRKPNSSLEELREYLNKVEEPFLNRIIIHSHHELVHEFELRGAHYTSELRKSIKPSALYDHRHEWHEKNKTLSSSFHTGDTFASSELFDYVFYSPVANSISKSEREMVDPLQLIIDLSFIKTDVVALGGICPDVMQSMELSFFEGVAALGWIWNKGGDPLVQFNTLKELCPVSASL